MAISDLSVEQQVDLLELRDEKVRINSIVMDRKDHSYFQANSTSDESFEDFEDFAREWVHMFEVARGLREDGEIIGIDYSHKW